MSIPLYFPPPVYLSHLKLDDAKPLWKICELAGVRCRASGAWTNRQIEIATGKQLNITAEPGDWGSVRIVVERASLRNQARLALGALAYALHDPVARQSIMEQPWSRLRPPRGRKRTGCALSNAERQRRFRDRMRA